MLVNVGIAADVKPSAEINRAPKGYYKLLIRKAEDKTVTLAVKDEHGNETGKRDATKFMLTTRLDPHEHPDVDGVIPSMATEWFYPDKADSWVNGVLLSIYMAIWPNQTEAQIRAAWNQIDPIKVFQPVNGVEKPFFVKWDPEGRTYMKDGVEKKAGSITVITPAAYKEARIEAAKHAAAAGGAGNGGGVAAGDPFGGAAAATTTAAPGGTTTAPVTNGAGAASADGDPFANMN